MLQGRSRPPHYSFTHSQNLPIRQAHPYIHLSHHGQIRPITCSLTQTLCHLLPQAETRAPARADPSSHSATSAPTHTVAYGSIHHPTSFPVFFSFLGWGETKSIIGRKNRSTRRKPASVPLCPPQIPHDLTWARTRATALGNRRLTACAMARPISFRTQRLAHPSRTIHLVTHSFPHPHVRSLAPTFNRLLSSVMVIPNLGFGPEFDSIPVYIYNTYLFMLILNIITRFWKCFLQEVL
jgi:hypothetical protein